MLGLGIAAIGATFALIFAAGGSKRKKRVPPSVPVAVVVEPDDNDAPAVVEPAPVEEVLPVEEIVAEPADVAEALVDEAVTDEEAADYPDDAPLVEAEEEIPIPVPAAPNVQVQVPPVTLQELDSIAENEGVAVEELPEAEEPVNMAPEVPVAPPLPVLPPPAVEVVPADTILVVRGMLKEESGQGWKKSSPALAVWQAKRGLKDDGYFGPKSALPMATEIGVIPIIRYWPKGQYPEGPWIEEYRSQLRAIAESAPSPRREQLLASAEREQGQGFGSPAKRIVNLATI